MLHSLFSSANAHTSLLRDTLAIHVRDDDEDDALWCALSHGMEFFVVERHHHPGAHGCMNKFIHNIHLLDNIHLMAGEVARQSRYCTL